jgi:hypothetical protein
LCTERYGRETETTTSRYGPEYVMLGLTTIEKKTPYHRPLAHVGMTYRRAPRSSSSWIRNPYRETTIQLPFFLSLEEKENNNFYLNLSNLYQGKSLQLSISIFGKVLSVTQHVDYYLPTDGKGHEFCFHNRETRMDEFCFHNRGTKIENTLFRISSMTNSFQYRPLDRPLDGTDPTV